MDEYGQIGPEKGTFTADCEEVAALIAKGAPVYVTLTHRLTRMEVVLTLKQAFLRPEDGGGPEGVFQEAPTAPWLLVTVIERGACWAQLGRGWTPHASYIASHMVKADHFNDVDAETVAAFLRELGEAWTGMAERAPAA